MSEGLYHGVVRCNTLAVAGRRAVGDGGISRKAPVRAVTGAIARPTQRGQWAGLPGAEGRGIGAPDVLTIGGQGRRASHEMLGLVISRRIAPPRIWGAAWGGANRRTLGFAGGKVREGPALTQNVRHATQNLARIYRGGASWRRNARIRGSGRCEYEGLRRSARRYRPTQRHYRPNEQVL